MAIEELLLLVAGLFICLIALERVWDEYRSRWRRRVYLRKYAHTDQGLFALSEGETIVGVLEEKHDLCFYVTRDGRDGTEYP